MNIRTKIMCANVLIASLPLCMAGDMAWKAIGDLHVHFRTESSLSAFKATLQVGSILAGERGQWAVAFDSDKPLDPAIARPLEGAIAASDAVLVVHRPATLGQFQG